MPVAGLIQGIVIPASSRPDLQQTALALPVTAGFAVLLIAFHWAANRLLAPIAQLSDSMFAPLKPAPAKEIPVGTIDPARRTAVLLVTGYNAFGLRCLLDLWRFLPEEFPQIIFLGVGPVEPSALRGYAGAARAMGMEAGFRAVPGPDYVPQAEKICLRLAEEFPSAVVCSGTLALHPERWYHRFLPDAACEAVRKRLHRRGLPTVPLTVRPEMKKAATRAAALSG